MKKPKTREEAIEFLTFCEGKSNLDLANIIQRSGRQVLFWKKDSRALADGAKITKKKEEPTVIYPEFEDEDISTVELIDKHLIPRSEKRLKHQKSKKWFKIKVTVKGPFAVIAFGDPHLDDNHCNWGLLKKHTQLASSQKYIFGLNIGDVHNNWVGSLTRLYAQQDTSRKTAIRLIRWFFKETGIQWLCHLVGNHDAWNNGGELIREISGEVIPMEDWRAQFILETPNGSEYLVDAAHDHKGQSMYNGLHAQRKAALFGKTPHLIIAGHRHFPEISKVWFPEENMVSWLVRVGSYKMYDEHAKVNQFSSHDTGAAMVIIFDPEGEAYNERMFVTDNLEFGLEMLESLRNKRGYSK